eukprot:6928836-Pyramimonas_sp.AAC.1
MRLKYLAVLFRIFSWAQRLAALILKTSKCFIAPLCGPFSEEIATVYRRALGELVPSWADFVVVPNLEYLGMWVGPS